MIHLSITLTGKSYNPQDTWRKFDDYDITFPDMASTKKFLKERYGNCKRENMYQDKLSGETVKVGYIYSFRADDISHTPVEKRLQRDWVSFYKKTQLTL